LSKIVSIICWPMHDRIDNKDWGNDVKDIPWRGRVYFAWDIHGNTLIEREVLSAAAEAGVCSGYRAERQWHRRFLGTVTQH